MEAAELLLAAEVQQQQQRLAGISKQISTQTLSYWLESYGAKFKLAKIRLYHISGIRILV